MGISRPVSLDHNVEETDLADFGIVVCMTRTAIVYGFGALQIGGMEVYLLTI